MSFMDEGVYETQAVSKGGLLGCLPFCSEALTYTV